MSLKQTFKKMSAGGFWTFSYSPRHLDLISSFDRRPLMLFLNYDTTKKYLQGINFHFLTVPQREKFISKITRRFKLKDGLEFGKPIKGLTYEWIKKNYPIAIIGYRRYFPNRARNIKSIAFQWDEKQIEDDVINSDTQRIIGVTSQQIQKLAIRAMKARGKTKIKKIRRKNIQRPAKVRRRR